MKTKSKTSSVGISGTPELIKTILNKLPKQWTIGDSEDYVLKLSGVQIDALYNVLSGEEAL